MSWEAFPQEFDGLLQFLEYVYLQVHQELKHLLVRFGEDLHPTIN